MAGRAVWARYQFLEELWRGQDRILFDPDLEEALRVGGPGLGHQSHPALTALSDALIPRAVGEDNVWVALANPRRAAEYARLRGGTTFIGLDEAAGVGSDEDWQVALVDLEGMLALEGETAQLEARLAALIEVLAEGAAAGRTVIVSAPSEVDGGLDYESFTGLIAEQLPMARVYGIGAAEAALVFDFGELEGTGDDLELVEDYEEGDLMPVGYDEDREVAEYEADLDAAEEEWTDHGITEAEAEADGEVDEDDEEVPVDYDNTLGEEEPEVRGWVAVCARRSLGEGMTVIELPAAPSPGPGPRDSALRAQLSQVQRQADLAAIERQRLAEQLDEAEERIASLVEEREQLLEGELDLEATRTPEMAALSPLPTPADAGDAAARLDAALAREQALRWELAQVSAELEQARSRPVDELEAEVAELRARLEAAGKGGAVAVEDEADEAFEPGEHEGVAETVFVFTETAPIPAESPRLRQEVDRLLRRIERGGMPTLELHRALKRLRGFFVG
jgi:hypothetical protein